MSSHHIVRDAQEPALFLLDFDDDAFYLIQELLEWSPVIVVLEDLVEKILQWEIKIDVVVCKKANHQNITLIFEEKMAVEILSSDEDLISVALNYLKDKNHQAVNMVGKIETKEKVFEFWDLLDIVIYELPYKAFYMKNELWRKWLPKNTSIKILARQFTANNLISENVLNHYKTTADGFVEIKNNGHPFWILEQVQ